MKYINVILITLCSIYSAAIFAETIPSKIIENDNTVRETATSRGGMEGWVQVSYVIGIDGKPKDIVAIDYSGKERYINSTIRYVNNLTFAPALVDGVPAISQKTLFLHNKFSGFGYSEGSVTPAFAEEYQLAMDLLSNTNPDLPKIRVLIDELKEDHSKNLNEHAMAAWLESLYYYKAQDFLEYMRQTYIAVKLNNYIPKKILIRSIMNLFEAQLYYGYYFEALTTLETMQNIGGLGLSEEIMDKFFAQAERKVDSTEVFQVSAKLSPLGGWIYQNNLKNFKLINVNGELESVKVRCTGYEHSYLENLQVPITVPADIDGCVTLVQGKKGTTFELVQVITG